MLVNCTPHELVIYEQDGKTVKLVIPPSGNVARVKTTADDVSSVFDDLPCPVVQTGYGEVEGLPRNEKSNVYIVSTLCLQAVDASDRWYDHAMVAPDTGPESVVRDESGKISGVRRFQVI